MPTVTRTTYTPALLCLLLLTLLVVGCTPATPTEASPSTPTEVTLAMGFIPNVQFAPVYVAIERDYFAEEGITLKLDYGMESDLLQLVGAGELDFALASGDQTILARAGGLPVRYVANWYRRYPVALISIKQRLGSPTDLRGQTLGLPGLFGASYIGWLAMAQASGLQEGEVTLESIGFNQVPVLAEGQVDAVMGYAMNEPLVLTQEGYAPSTLAVSDYVDLVANGLITNDRTIQNNPDLVRGMVRALLRGIRDTLDDPDRAFEVTLQYVPEAGGDQAEAQRAVLEASLPFWQNERLGYLPASTWEASQQFMLGAGLIKETLPLEQLYTDEFLPEP